MSADEDPEDELTVHEPATSAAGVPAVANALRYSLGQTSVRRTALTLLNVNQASGIDCPGCAWPDPGPGDRPANEYCENGAKHINDEATTSRVTAEFFAKHPISELAGKSDRWLNQRGRLTEPVVKRPGADHYEPISWDEALGLLAAELRALNSPDEAIFYTSGRVGNEAAFLLQLFARAFGTNNLPDCSNMCHESSGEAMRETLGVGKGSVGLDDLHQADLVLVVGQNPGTDHPRMLSALERTKRNGGQVIVVNPLPEAGLMRFKNPKKAREVLGRGTSIADQFLQIRPGGDLALFQALNRLLLEAEQQEPGTVLDHRSSPSTPADSPSSPTTSAVSTTTSRLPPGWPATRSSLRTRKCSRAGESSCAGRWGSPNTSTGWRPSARSSTSCCCAGTSADPAPARGRCAVTATCRATGPWAFGNACPSPSWTRWARSSTSPHPLITGGTRWRPSAPCWTDEARSSWGRGELRAREPGQRPHRAGDAAVPGDRARLDQAQPLPHRLR